MLKRFIVIFICFVWATSVLAQSPFPSYIMATGGYWYPKWDQAIVKDSLENNIDTISIAGDAYSILYDTIRVGTGVLSTVDTAFVYNHSDDSTDVLYLSASSSRDSVWAANYYPIASTATQCSVIAYFYKANGQTESGSILQFTLEGFGPIYITDSYTLVTNRVVADTSGSNGRVAVALYAQDNLSPIGASWYKQEVIHSDGTAEITQYVTVPDSSSRRLDQLDRWD